MAFIGWNPGGEREIYTLSELISVFDLSKIHKGGAIFNKEKLLWMNKEHMRLQSEEKKLEAVQPYFTDYSADILIKMLPTIIDRISAYGELTALEKDEFRFFIERPLLDGDLVEKIVWKDREKSEACTHLDALTKILESADFSSPETLKAAIMPYAEIHGKGNVLWPLRMSLSGKEKSVDPFTISYILGKEEVLFRISAASKALDS